MIGYEKCELRINILDIMNDYLLNFFNLKDF